VGWRSSCGRVELPFRGIQQRLPRRLKLRYALVLKDFENIGQIDAAIVKSSIEVCALSALRLARMR